MTAQARGRHPLAAAVTGTTLAALLAAAWFVPPLAILVVWPLLFVIPGWAVMSLVRPRIAATGRLGLAVILSVAGSAHLVYWLSMATGGYQREVIWIAAGMLAAPLVVASWRGGAARLGGEIGSGWRALRREAAGFIFAVAMGALVALILASGLWHPVPNGVAAGGSNWSDLGVHLAIAQSLNAGNFPPQVPYFAGAPLVYHWFSDFHAAIAASAAGLFAIPAFVVSSAILAAALALLVHGLAHALLPGRGARRAALVAAALVVLGGGLGWIRLVGDVSAGLGDPLALIARNSYDNAWLTESPPYFRIPSVMGTGLLVHRATTAGLPMLAGALLLLVAGLPNARRLAAGWRDRPALITLAGACGALLAPFHFFYFPVVPILVLAWVIVGGRLVDRHAARNAALFLAPYLLALPFALSAAGQAAASGDLRWVPGWESAPWTDGTAAVVFFYLTNLGIPFVLALVALLNRRTPERAFLAAWLAILFIIPNLVQVSIVSFDMNKLFQAMWIGVALAAAALLRRWPWPIAVLVVALSAPSPLLAGAWTAVNRLEVLSHAELRAADWIATNTPPGAVFVTNGWLNSPTDPAGRLRVLTYSVYIANLGLDPTQRMAQVDQVYCGGNAARAAELADAMQADYLLDTGPPRSDCEARTDFGSSPRWTLAYRDGGLAIWKVESGATSVSSES